MANCGDAFWRKRLRYRPTLVQTFADLLDDLGREGLEVARVAACDDALIDDHLFVDPVGARVFNGGRHRVIGGHLAAFGEARLDQNPWRVTDRGDRLL